MNQIIDQDEVKKLRYLAKLTVVNSVEDHPIWSREDHLRNAKGQPILAAYVYHLPREGQCYTLDIPSRAALNEPDTLTTSLVWAVWLDNQQKHPELLSRKGALKLTFKTKNTTFKLAVLSYY